MKPNVGYIWNLIKTRRMALTQSITYHNKKLVFELRFDGFINEYKTMQLKIYFQFFKQL